MQNSTYFFFDFQSFLPPLRLIILSIRLHTHRHFTGQAPPIFRTLFYATDAHKKGKITIGDDTFSSIGPGAQ